MELLQSCTKPPIRSNKLALEQSMRRIFGQERRESCRKSVLSVHFENDLEIIPYIYICISSALTLLSLPYYWRQIFSQATI